MKLIADFHIHSKFSRATSPRSDLKNLDKWCRIKGVDILGTGDFTHPGWIGEIKQKLEPAEPGLFKLGLSFQDREGVNGISLASKNDPRFLLTSEISCIYSKKSKVRKIHVIIFSPSIEKVEALNHRLSEIGNLKADGRPILGLDVKELLKIVLDTCPDCLFVLAHIWTPWFSVFGSRSGFDSIEECFDDYSKYVYVGETGLSSDPAMNWRLSALDKIALISNSDAHSAQKIAREANVFDTDLSYPAIIDAIKSRDPKKFLYTIEFFPEEGKYHYDGHRTCNICSSPKETKKYNGLCPVCGKPLTVGVLSRVEQLADRPKGFKPEQAIPFKSLIPLKEVIGEVLSVGPAAKRVLKIYGPLIERFGSELEVLLNVSKKELEAETLQEIAEGIVRVREGKVFVEPGYDGVYGKVSVFSKDERKEISNQKTLF